MSEAERDQLTSALADEARKPFDDREIESLTAFLRNDVPIPERLCANLARFGHLGNSLGVFLVRNMPIEDVASGYRLKTSLTQLGQLRLGLELGRPMAYENAWHGKFFHSIRPIKRHARQQYSASNSVKLGWHMDWFGPIVRPHYVNLMCVREDPAAATLVSCPAASAIDPVTRDILKRKLFYVDCRGEKISRYFGIFEKSAKRTIFSYFGIVVQGKTITGKSPAAKQALLRLKQHLEDHSVAVTLARGDMLIIDNFRACHGRSRYVPRFDNADRWLLRLMTTTDKIPRSFMAEGRPRVLKSDVSARDRHAGRN